MLFCIDVLYIERVFLCLRYLFLLFLILRLERF